MAADLAANRAAETDQNTNQRTISFAAGLAPLVVGRPEGSAHFRTAAAIAATPLAGGPGYAATDIQSTSILVLKPKWREEEQVSQRRRASCGIRALPQQQLLKTSAVIGTNTASSEQPSLGPRGTSAGGPLSVGQQRQRQTTRSKSPERLGRAGAPPPPVLRFECWRYEGGQRVQLDLAFHVATSELSLRSSDGFEATVVVQAASGPRAGTPLEPWDFHIGATMRILGRQITLRKADPRTRAWLDTEATLLSAHRRRLLEDLSKFIPVPKDSSSGGASTGLLGNAGTGLLSSTTAVQQSGGAAAKSVAASGGCRGVGGEGPAAAVAHFGGGGAVSLRKLRDEVAALAGRLRQFKAHVPLPPELQPLVGEGPASWRIDGAAPSPRRAGVHTWRGGGDWGVGSGAANGAEAGQCGVVEVGATPTWVGQLAEWKHKQRLLQLSGLAASAAVAAEVAGQPGSAGGGD